MRCEPGIEARVHADDLEHEACRIGRAALLVVVACQREAVFNCVRVGLPDVFPEFYGACVLACSVVRET